MKPGKRIVYTLMLTLLLSSVLTLLPVSSVHADYENWKPVTFTESAGVARTDEPVDIAVTFDTPTPVADIRVLDPSLTEIPSQVYNTVGAPAACTSANIAFLADCPASSSVTYYVVYNKKTPAAAPVYDGLRLNTIAAGDTYNVTAVAGVEKNYFHIFWMSMFDLYSNNTMVALGNVFFGFGQMSLAGMWNDAWGNTWFGAGKSLGVVNSGPIFVEFNYSEAYATDWLGGGAHTNVTKTDLVRVWYQPDLNPLVRQKSNFVVNTNLANYTVGGPVFLDFKVRNSSTLPIYRNLTYSQGWLGTVVNPIETGLLWTSIYYPPWSLYGWVSLNGSRPDSTDKPAANIGYIPVDASGTIAADYQISFTHSVDPADHPTQWMIGDYNGAPGEYASATGYIVTYSGSLPPAIPYMSNKATKVSNPLGYTAGSESTQGAEVGGHINPLNTLALLAPWIILAVAVALAAVSVAVFRKHRLAKSV